MNQEDRLMLCSKFNEIRMVLRWQTIVLVAIAISLGVELAPGV